MRDSSLLRIFWISWFFIKHRSHSWAYTYVKAVTMLSDELVHFHRMLHWKSKSLSLFLSLSSPFLSFSLFFPLFSLSFILYFSYSVERHISLAHSSTNTLLSPNFTFGYLTWIHYIFPVVLELAIFLFLNTYGLY